MNKSYEHASLFKTSEELNREGNVWQLSLWS